MCECVLFIFNQLKLAISSGDLQDTSQNGRQNNLQLSNHERTFQFIEEMQNYPNLRDVSLKG